ncbi:aldose epimerase family protein [Tropicibacter naphthalenivorans]|uniref:Aldose 1-epimerase n=1 Tax=Tropicibacter naphthalenivorans TaxID=441103 RepID=A0A0P1GCG6_9RHOB|nr:aldose epimerase family protein [Tropicibacter naphthalenivorans]CUH79116.1 Aldose 1-epimerase [Tropicibacter naphthalenivorans]SMD03420.1 aldose 1-epimerase [Tropicibacter naphthalenivorans]
MTQIQSHTLRDGDTEVTVLNIGGVIQDWTVGGQRVVLGHSDPEVYRENPASMGMIPGRVANRIKDARFTLDGIVYHLPKNSGEHSLHGGPEGIGKQIWQMEPEGPRAVTLRLHSPDGQCGYPGNVDFTVRISLDGGALTWDMRAVPDRVTPINLAQHVYFNLNGTDDIRDHRFTLDAPAYTPTDADLIPTGEIAPVAGTRFDFRAGPHLSEIDADRQGYDVNFVLAEGDHAKVRVTAPNGMQLEMWTDQPGVQLYTSTMLTPHGTPWPGQTMNLFSGFCVEAQAFPNAVNQKGFGNILCSPETPYRQVTTIRIARID